MREALKEAQKAYALEEVVVRPFNLTGYIEIDAKMIPTIEKGNGTDRFIAFGRVFSGTVRTG